LGRRRAVGCKPLGKQMRDGSCRHGEALPLANAEAGTYGDDLAPAGSRGRFRIMIDHAIPITPLESGRIVAGPVVGRNVDAAIERASCGASLNRECKAFLIPAR